jgi:hypothetical protein
MGNPRAYVIDGDVDPVPISEDDSWRETSRRVVASPGPEILSIVRFGNSLAHWIVVSMSSDRLTASIAPLNQGGKVGMKHGVSVSRLWPYYGQLEKSARKESA